MHLLLLLSLLRGTEWANVGNLWSERPGKVRELNESRTLIVSEHSQSRRTFRKPYNAPLSLSLHKLFTSLLQQIKGLPANLIRFYSLTVQQQANWWKTKNFKLL